MAKRKSIIQTARTAVKKQAKKHPALKPAAKQATKELKRLNRRISLFWIPLAYFLYRFTFEESFGARVENQIGSLVKRLKAVAKSRGVC